MQLLKNTTFRDWSTQGLMQTSADRPLSSRLAGMAYAILALDPLSCYPQPCRLPNLLVSHFRTCPYSRLQELPVDAVDSACQRHDAAYNACADSLRERQGARATPKLLSVLTALRATGLTTPVLESIGVDSAYLRCSHVADQGLIRDGLQVRGESQRTMCQGSAYTYPRWFCDLDSLTLARIERVDFDLFLANLDWDDARSATAVRRDGRPAGPGLKSLEATRRETLKRAAAHAPLGQAWESVRSIEADMLAKLN
jgi:hypothetical protein